MKYEQHHSSLKRGLTLLDRPFISDGTADMLGLAGGIIVAVGVLNYEGVHDAGDHLHNLIVAGILGFLGGLMVDAGVRSLE